MDNTFICKYEYNTEFLKSTSQKGGDSENRKYILKNTS